MKKLLKKPLRLIELILWTVFWGAISLTVSITLGKAWPLLLLLFIIIPTSHILCFDEHMLWNEKLHVASQYIQFICIGLFIFAPESLFWLYCVIAILNTLFMFFTIYLYRK